MTFVEHELGLRASLELSPHRLPCNDQRGEMWETTCGTIICLPRGNKMLLLPHRQQTCPLVFTELFPWASLSQAGCHCPDISCNFLFFKKKINAVDFPVCHGLLLNQIITHFLHRTPTVTLLFIIICFLLLSFYFLYLNLVLCCFYDLPRCLSCLCTVKNLALPQNVLCK